VTQKKTTKKKTYILGCTTATVKNWSDRFKLQGFLAVGHEELLKR